MIELLVSRSKPQRELEREESLGQSIEKLIGGAEKGKRVASYSQYPH